MRITQGRGARRNTTTIVGSVRNAQGNVSKALIHQRKTVAAVLRSVLFPKVVAA